MKRNFKIHSICVVKNEEDVIEHCLREASRWSDYIYVYDQKSSDNTWNIVTRMASDKIIPWKQDGQVFRDGLRAEVFNAFSHMANDGDWWCRLDADEFYINSPRDFLAKIANPYSVVWAIAIEYYLTLEDIKNLDFSLPIDKFLPNLRYYKVENSEPRFFKHRKKLSWAINDSWPLHMGLVYNKRILYRHYKYRSLKQIKSRLETRKEEINNGFLGWEHARGSWKDKIIKDTKDLSYDLYNGKFCIDFKKLPFHQGKIAHVALQYLMYSLGIWP